MIADERPCAKDICGRTLRDYARLDESLMSRRTCSSQDEHSHADRVVREAGNAGRPFFECVNEGILPPCGWGGPSGKCRGNSASFSAAGEQLRWQQSCGTELMSELVRATIFDIDGVLIDSLPQHLQICRDKAREFGLALSIPSVEEFRVMVRAGVKVSPMLEFFRAVGFPERFAERALADYKRDFMARYRPKPFPGVEEMLATLHSAGLALGIVTSNMRANVVPALGNCMRYFDPRAQIFFDTYSTPKEKSWCLLEIARNLDIPPSDCVYIGDQPIDATAADQVGVQFLGVTYGWGLMAETQGMNLVSHVREIGLRLAARASPSGTN